MSKAAYNQQYNEFGLVRVKYRYGEGLDFGLPTKNGYLGKMFIKQGLQTGRIIPIQEIADELDYIVNHSPEDDKTAKRRERITFLNAVNEDPILKKFSESVIFWLNGGMLNLEKEVLGVVVSGGNIILILATLFRLALYCAGRETTDDDEDADEDEDDMDDDEYADADEDADEDEDADDDDDDSYSAFVRVCYGFGIPYEIEGESVQDAIDEWFGVSTAWIQLIKDLASNSPSDLDYKIIPLSKAALRQHGKIPLTDPNEDSLQMVVQEAQDVAQFDTGDDQFDTGHAIETLLNLANQIESEDQTTQMWPQTPLLTQAELTDTISATTAQLEELMRNRVSKPPKPRGFIGELFTQIAQEKHYGDCKNVADEDYLNYLLHEKKIIGTSTKLNSLSLAESYSINDQAPPLLTFMFSIHLISIQCNSRLNALARHWLDHRTRSNTGQWFSSVYQLRNSNILQCVTQMAGEITRFPIITNFFQTIENNVLEIRGTSHGSAGSYWLSPMLGKQFRDEMKPVLEDIGIDDNIRISVNTIRTEHQEDIDDDTHEDIDEMTDLTFVTAANILLNLGDTYRDDDEYHDYEGEAGAGEGKAGAGEDEAGAGEDEAGAGEDEAGEDYKYQHDEYQDEGPAVYPNQDEDDYYLCPQCGWGFKTERGRKQHMSKLGHSWDGAGADAGAGHDEELGAYATRGQLEGAQFGGPNIVPRQEYVPVNSSLVIPNGKYDMYNNPLGTYWYGDSPSSAVFYSGQWHVLETVYGGGKKRPRKTRRRQNHAGKKRRRTKPRPHKTRPRKTRPRKTRRQHNNQKKKQTKKR